MEGQEEWEGSRNGREGGVGGQEKWEGRRSGREGGVSGQKEWESRRNGRTGHEEVRTQRTCKTQRTNTCCNHLMTCLTGD